MVYTSYFANAKKLQKYGVGLVSIARSSPKWFNGEYLMSLAPTWEMLKMSDDEYDKNYEKILQSHNPHAIMELFEGKDVALLCWEKDVNQCHRKRVAEWLSQNGYDVREFEEPPKKEVEVAPSEPDFVQMTLF